MPSPERSMNNMCRHYLPAGQGNKCCAVGVNYADLQVRLDLKPLDVVRICMGRQTGCELHEPYTEEELSFQQLEMRDAMDRVQKTRDAIHAKTRGKRGQAGKIDCVCCPVGTILFSTAEHNGLISAKCSTPGCVSFQE